MYKTYRHGGYLAYRVDLPPAGYEVTLKFADFLGSGSGENVFNVLAQGATVVENLDVFAQAGGGAAAYDRTFQVTVDPGAPLTIGLGAISGEACLSAMEIRWNSPCQPLEVYLSKPGGGAFQP